MFKPISRLVFYLTNKLVKYVKNLTFDFYRFNITYLYCTILNAKIKSIIFLNNKINIAKIII